jgi:hypothetical protein
VGPKKPISYSLQNKYSSNLFVFKFNLELHAKRKKNIRVTCLPSSRVQGSLTSQYAGSTTSDYVGREMLTRIRFIGSIALRHYSYYQPSTMTVHSIAQSGFGTGNELYDRCALTRQCFAFIPSHLRAAPDLPTSLWRCPTYAMQSRLPRRSTLSSMLYTPSLSESGPMRVL